MISWWAVALLGIIATPVGIISMTILACSYYCERQQYKYHRVRRERFGDGECCIGCVSTIK